MEKTETLVRLYSALLKNQGLITPAPVLHVTAEQLSQNPDEEVMMQDLLTVTCSLLGAPEGSRDVDFFTKALNQKFPNPGSFWRMFMTEVIGLIDPSKKPKAAGALIEQGKHVLKQLNDYIADRNALVAVCEKKIKDAGFPLDAHALLLNYVNMAYRQPEQAWDILTTTPAYFSPIVTTDEKGKTVISPAKGKQINADLAEFLKNMKI